MALTEKDIALINEYFGFTILWNAYEGPVPNNVRQALLELIADRNTLKKLVRGED
jgi:hypothetical protein